jgi:hypothetical protein
VDSCPADDPRRVLYRFNLGTTLHRRYLRTDEPDDLTEAVDAYRDVAESVVTPSAVRAEAARGRTLLAAAGNNWPVAATAARLALELVGRTADRGLGRADQERLLEPSQGLASLAAACALNAGDPAAAVELLEAGRGVLLAQSLELRSDLSALYGRRPALAVRFAELRDLLDAPPVPEVVATTRRPDGRPQPVKANGAAG